MNIGLICKPQTENSNSNWEIIVIIGLWHQSINPFNENRNGKENGSRNITTNGREIPFSMHMSKWLVSFFSPNG